MTDPDDDILTQGYWPSVTDLFLTLFIIAIAIVAVVFCALLPKNDVGVDRSIVVAVGTDMKHIRKPVNELRSVLGLKPIPEFDSPDKVVAAVKETCDVARQRIDHMEKIIATIDPDDCHRELTRLQQENESLKQQVKELEEKLRQYSGSEIEDLSAKITELEKQLNDKPPIIQISEHNKDYRFESGSSVMGSAFISGLRNVEFNTLATEILKRDKGSGVKVNTLEIIGHTDGVPLSGNGNLDQRLPDVLAGSAAGPSGLRAGSNNDLGLLRALAVREQWDNYIREKPDHEREILGRIRVRCYSAGQTILPEEVENPIAEDFRQPDPGARRIEMRLTRLQDPKND